MSNDIGTGWAVAGAFLEAFAGRDFAALAECLDPEVHFRALIPPGLVDVTGADDTVGRFRHWFGADTFELYRTLLALRRRHPWIVDGVVDRKSTRLNSSHT